MAITITLDFPYPRRIEKGDPTGVALLSGTIKDSQYATGGTDLTGLTKYFKTPLRIITDNKGGFLTEWDKTNNKMLIYRMVDNVAGTRIEVVNITDLSATPGAFSFIAIGLVG